MPLTLKARKLNDRTLILQDVNDYKRYLELTKDIFGKAKIQNTFREEYATLNPEHSTAEETAFIEYQMGMDVMDMVLEEMYERNVDLSSKEMLTVFSLMIDRLTADISSFF